MKRYYVNNSNEIVSEVGQAISQDTAFLKSVSEQEAKGLVWAAGTAQRWAQEKAKGYFDSATKTTFSLDNDSMAFRATELSTLIAGIQAGTVKNTDSHKAWDIRNKEITLTTAEYVALLVRIGVHYRSIYAQFAP